MIWRVNHYRRISPTDSVEVDTKLAAAAEAAAKKKSSEPRLTCRVARLSSHVIITGIINAERKLFW